MWCDGLVHIFEFPFARIIGWTYSLRRNRKFCCSFSPFIVLSHPLDRKFNNSLELALKHLARWCMKINEYQIDQLYSKSVRLVWKIGIEEKKWKTKTFLLNFPRVCNILWISCANKCAEFQLRVYTWNRVKTSFAVTVSTFGWYRASFVSIQLSWQISLWMRIRL